MHILPVPHPPQLTASITNERQVHIQVGRHHPFIRPEPPRHVRRQHQDCIRRHVRIRHREPLIGRIVQRPFQPLRRSHVCGIRGQRDHVPRQRADPLRAAWGCACRASPRSRPAPGDPSGSHLGMAAPPGRLSELAKPLAPSSSVRFSCYPGLRLLAAEPRDSRSFRM